MMSHYHINKDFCKSQNINNDFDQYKIHSLCKPIKNNQNRVIILIFLIS